MKSFGQFCPLAQASQLLCERWTLLLVREFIAGSTRFSELQKGVPLMSPTLLSTRLKQLCESGVITKSGKGSKTAYKLTKAGTELTPIVQLLGAWGHRWVQTSLVVQDLDASLLMWDMRRTVSRDEFPSQRIIVQFEYSDASKGATDWWLVSENGEVDLCLTEPAGEVDIVIKSALATMTAVWTCQTSFKKCVRNGEILVYGDPKLVKKLQDWLQASALSRLGAQGDLPEVNWQTAQ